MRKSTSFITIIILFLCAFFIAYGDESKSDPQVHSPAHYFPEGALVYAELQDTAPLFDGILDSPLWWNITTHPAYQKFSETMQFGYIVKSVRYVESNTGISLPQLTAKLFGKKVGLAVYERNSKPAWLFVAKHDNPKTVKDTIQAIAQLAFMAGNMKRMPEFQDIEGIAVMDLKKVALCVGKSWFAISPHEDLLRDFYSRAEQKKSNSTPSLAQSSTYKEALKAKRDGRLFAFVNYREILTRQGKTDIFTKKPDQPLLTLVFGSLINAIKTSNVLSISGDIQEDGTLALSAGYPYQAGAYAQEYNFAMAPKDEAHRGFVSPTNKQVLFSLDLNRDIALWWQNREALHHKRLIPGFVNFNTNIGQLFGGIDISEDFFGKMLSDFRLIGVQTKYEQGNPNPLLPGFVLSFRVKNPQEFTKAIRVGYQSGIGLANFERAKNGKDVMLICSETTEQGMITGARWVEPKNKEKLTDIQYNFSPCIAQSEKTIYMASSIEALREVLNKPLVCEGISQEIQDRFYISGTQLSRILKENEEILIWNKMMEVGGDKEKATTEIQILLDMVQQFNYLEIATHQNDQTFFLELKTKINRLNGDSSKTAKDSSYSEVK